MHGVDYFDLSIEWQVKKLSIQMLPAHAEWGGLCVAGELAGIPPGVHYTYLSVHGSN